MGDHSVPSRDSGGEFLFQRLREEVARAARHDLPLALMVFHVQAPGVAASAGRPLLRATTLLARAMVRESDVVAPLDGQHFGVVANTTREGAAHLAEAVAHELEAFEFTCGGRRVGIEVTYGLSSLDGPKTPQTILEEARAAVALGAPRPQLQGRS